ncbi:MAG TPA: SRPBCC domain-containing protein [Candidatus Saccharimonadales bacterium]|nr:SRPBCC domain-containing protein [Candidatus Saccharimonadales bacterium]
MDTSAHVNRVINAPIEAVFAAWTQPEQLQQWHAPEGLDVPQAVSENHVGGRRYVQMKMGDDLFDMEGTYLEYDEPNKLVYSWTDPNSIVTVEFKALNDKTEVTLIQTNVGTGGEAQDGWNRMFARFEAMINSKEQ